MASGNAMGNTGQAGNRKTQQIRSPQMRMEYMRPFPLQKRPQSPRSGGKVVGDLTVLKRIKQNTPVGLGDQQNVETGRVQTLNQLNQHRFRAADLQILDIENDFYFIRG